MADPITGPILGTEAGLAFGAGIAMAMSALAAAWSQGTLGSAALGAAAERPELEKNILVYLALPELIALLGFVVALLMVFRIGA